MTFDEQLAQRADTAFNNRLFDICRTFGAELDMHLALPHGDTLFTVLRNAIDTLRATPEIAAAIEAKRAAHRDQFIKGVVDGLLASKVVA